MVGSGQSFASEEGETVDALVWRVLGTRGGQVVERVLAANPGIAALGPVLPMGTLVFVPVMPEAAEVEAVRLWD